MVGKRVLGLFILANIVYILMLVVTIPRTMDFSNGMDLLDMMPMGYDWAYVDKLFSNLGEEGRSNYLTVQLPVDMLYPFLFGISYCLVIAYFINKLNRLHSPCIFLCLLPILAGIADYLENFGIISMLKGYPDLSEFSVNMTSIFSVVKSTSTSVFFIAIIIMLLILGFQAISRKKVRA
ncbi:hypothetical protein [Cyclobacterium amurskyense]|uniref:Uncharacterized protein n=1 Tax=Cyclobacterium amurskyense TaxID=320787 RepID=A0A0H4PXL9_9BACT|nr:hypothetical protein [Cyclobacterium amurskyense]AKP53147.1 hypothetical protein CA2015_3775 [Cyclobacterium amurskyense]